MHTGGGSPVAFVEYQDVRYAAQAMATLQGSLLLSSDRGAIRIEYAKSKMAEVGFTNLWIEVGFILCYASRYLLTYTRVRRRKRSTVPLSSAVRWYLTISKETANVAQLRSRLHSSC